MVALLLFVGMYGQQARTVTAEESVWFKPQTPGLEVFPDRAPLSRSDYNTDCVPETGVIRPAGFVPPNPTPFTEQTVSDCAVRSAGGRFMSSYYKRDGTHLYASLGEAARPIPGSTSVLRYFNGNSQSSNVNVIPNFSSLLKPVALSDGKLRYDLAPYTPISLRDPTGSLLNVDHKSVSFSADGRWLIASTFQGMLRYNLDTQEQLLFDTSLSYQSGIAPQVQSAITNNGRYAVIATGPHSRFRLYDLHNCPTINTASLGRRNCQYREMFGSFPPKTGDHVTFQEVRFLSDTSLRVYRREQFSSTTTSAQYLILAPGTTAPRFNYLALGDSYAAGNGAYQYRFGTNTDNNQCRNSELSYPYLIKAQLALSQAESVACSGARTWDISNNDIGYTGQAKDSVGLSQRNVHSILSLFSPGYIPQKNFVEALLPDIVTIGIGGNDIGFGDKLRACIAPGTCFSSYEDRLETFREINDAFDTFVSGYVDIKAAVRPTAKIYALGYPEIARSDGNCAMNVLLNRDEITFSNLMIAHLNEVLRRAASKADISYLDVSQAFAGYRLCETVYSNTAVNGLTAGHDAIDWKLFKGPIAGESYHPNALGHRLYKQLILSLTNNLQINSENTSPTSPLAVSDSDPLLQAQKTKRPTYRRVYEPELLGDIIYRGTAQNITISADYSLKPSSPFEITIASGDFTWVSNSQGILSGVFSAPINTPAGFTTLTITGQNLAGESIQLYKTVYVAGSEEDIDGDGEPNESDTCPVFVEQSPDSDQDGTDDLCDSTFNTASSHAALPPASSNHSSANNVLREVLPEIATSASRPQALGAQSQTIADNPQRVQSSIIDMPGKIVFMRKSLWWLLVLVIFIFMVFVCLKARRFNRRL